MLLILNPSNCFCKFWLYLFDMFNFLMHYFSSSSFYFLALFIFCSDSIRLSLRILQFWFRSLIVASWFFFAYNKSYLFFVSRTFACYSSVICDLKITISLFFYFIESSSSPRTITKDLLPYYKFFLFASMKSFYF